MSFKVTRSDPKGSVTNTEVSGEVSAVEGSFTTSKVEPAGSVSYINISAATSYIRSVFSVSYSSIFAADIQLGLFIIRKTLEDAALFTDYIDSIAFNKSLYDDVAAVEDIVRSTLKKVADDPAYTTDLISFGFSTSFSDSNNISDYHYLSPNKVLYETSTFADGQYLGIGKSNEDIAVFTEETTRAFGKGLYEGIRFYDNFRLHPNKHNIDYVEFYDSNTASFGKGLYDLLSFNDANLLFELDYHLADFIGATDDFYGAANIDDDQTMQFSKLTTDLASVAESFSRDVQFDRRLYDPAYGSDYVYLDTTKSLADTAGFSDSLSTVMHFVRFLDDQANANDFIARVSFSKTAEADSAFVNDVFTRNVAFSRTLEDFGSFEDLLVKATNSSLSDAGLAFDAFSRQVSYSRPYDDSIGVSVFIANTPHKYLADDSAASDYDVKSTGKVSSDLVNITDTGSLFWQNYTVDTTYFAEDYVGDRQLF
jgi:hypothetical protein